MPNWPLIRTVLVAASGNFLEWYDFACYGIFASEIGDAFFPPADETTKLIESFVVFSGAFFARPLGGLLFGHIGDTHGREVALLITVIFMALPTLVIALLPPYAQIGIAAPLMLASMRLLQGVAAGGELPGALVYAIESADARNRGQMGALCQATGLGSLVASAIAAILHLVLADSAVRAWGWRVPFFLGAGLSVVFFTMRRSFKPTAAFLEQQAKKRAADSSAAPGQQSAGGMTRLAHTSPACAAFMHSYGAVARIVFALPVAMAGFYSLFVFLPAYLRSSRIFAYPFELNVCAMLLWAVAVVGGGVLADAVPRPLRLGGRGRRPPWLTLHGYPLVSAAGALLLALVAPLLFASLSADCSAQHAYHAAHNQTAEPTPNRTASTNDEEVPACTGAAPPLAFIPLLAVAVVAHALHAGPLQAWMVLSLKETGSRYSALGIAYNFGAMLMGGTTPLIATSLAGSSFGVFGAGIHLSVAAVVAVTTLVLSEHIAPILRGEAEQLLRLGQVAPREVDLTHVGPSVSSLPPPSPPTSPPDGDDDDDDDGGGGWMCGDDKAKRFRTFALPRAGVSLRIVQSIETDRVALWAAGAGGVVWEAAGATLAFLDRTYADSAGGVGALSGKRVLECGAGTGVCGLACAAMGADHIVLTDLPAALKPLQANLGVAATAGHPWATHVHVAALAWGALPLPPECAPPFDLVVCCDCLYRPADYPALAATLRALRARRVVVSWVARGKDEDLFVDMIREDGVELTWVSQTDNSAVRILQVDRVDDHGGAHAQTQPVAEVEPVATRPLAAEAVDASSGGISKCTSSGHGLWVAVVGAREAKGVKDVLKARAWLAEDYKAGSVSDGMLAFPIVSGRVDDVRAAIASEAALGAVVEIRKLADDALPAKKKAAQQQPPAAAAAEADGRPKLPPAALKAKPSWQPRSFGGGAASRAAATDPLPPATPILRVEYAQASGETPAAWLRREVFARREPAVVRGLPLGACGNGWSVERLRRAQCSAPAVSVHVCASETVDLAGHRPPNTPRNFVFRSMPFAEAVMRCSGTMGDDAPEDGHAGSLEPLLAPGERYYLRSVGLDPRKHTADFPTLFPDLAAECTLVPTAKPTRAAGGAAGGEGEGRLLDPAAYHSSVLRLASDDTQLWTHFDVMDNMLAQLTGRKRVVMWAPEEDDNLYVEGSSSPPHHPVLTCPLSLVTRGRYVEGSSSRVADIDSWNDDEFPRFRRAVPRRLETELTPGDVLFIPALWFHNVTSIGFSVALNVFWRSHHAHGGGRHAASDLYSPKDLYGNKDPPAAELALSHAAAAEAELRKLPEPFRSFYARRAARMLLEVAEGAG